MAISRFLFAKLVSVISIREIAVVFPNFDRWRLYPWLHPRACIRACGISGRIRACVFVLVSVAVS